jgi:hypothetical protein
VERRARETRIGVLREIGDLLEETAVQGIHRALQPLHAHKEALNYGAFGMEGRIRAVQVILDQLLQITVMILIGELLPRFKIEARLVEATAETLAVLGDEAGHKPAGHDRADQKQPIQKPTQDCHHAHL